VFIDSVFNFPTLSELYKYAHAMVWGRLARRSQRNLFLLLHSGGHRAGFFCGRFSVELWRICSKCMKCVAPTPGLAGRIWQCLALLGGVEPVCRVAANAQGTHARCSVSAKALVVARWRCSWRVLSNRPDPSGD
jgi:hypothetical protein